MPTKYIQSHQSNVKLTPLELEAMQLRLSFAMLYSMPGFNDMKNMVISLASKFEAEDRS